MSTREKGKGKKGQNKQRISLISTFFFLFESKKSFENTGQAVFLKNLNFICAKN